MGGVGLVAMLNAQIAAGAVKQRQSFGHRAQVSKMVQAEAAHEMNGYSGRGGSHGGQAYVRI